MYPLCFSSLVVRYFLFTASLTAFCGIPVWGLLSSGHIYVVRAVAKQEALHTGLDGGGVLGEVAFRWS